MGYLMAGQPSELERLTLQARVWEPAGRRLLDEIGEGAGLRAPCTLIQTWARTDGG